jgi:hypothetical protein
LTDNILGHITSSIFINFTFETPNEEQPGDAATPVQMSAKLEEAALSSAHLFWGRPNDAYIALL